MSTENTFTLDDLAKATRKRLGPTTLILGEDLEVTLPSIFRLPQKTREKVWDALRQVSGLGDDGEEDDEHYELLATALEETLLLVTPDAQKILDAVALAAEDDALLKASLLGEVIGKWMEHVQVGEA